MGYCISCGTELPDGSAFCNRCGRPQTEPVAKGVGEALSSKSRSQRVWLFLGVMVAIAVVVGGVVMQSQRVAEASARAAAAEAAGEAVNAVAAVDSALSVGISFTEYSAKVQDAMAACDRYSPSDPTGEEIEKHLLIAMKAYARAQDVWNEDIQGYASNAEQRRQAAWAAASIEVAAARELLADY